MNALLTSKTAGYGLAIAGPFILAIARP